MLYLYNSLSKHKDLFVPLNKNHIKMYVCGPTVYDYIHIGNARPIVVFDTLYRLLSYLYQQVTYVRNITDVDDKIINRALENSESISELTQRTTIAFHEDIKKLNALTPTNEPKATDYIPHMIKMIEQLIASKHAYVCERHVYFDVTSFPNYGKLSGMNQEDILAGSRVEVELKKKNPSDFVLWKPSNLDDNCGWESPWGYGRVGWHIECSAMARELLGEQFDIHGGGKDLLFPHHENEIAQSACCSSKPNQNMANYWLHNGFVVVDGNKMSKSLGNFITLNNALKNHHGEVVRLTLLKSHYRQPLDFSAESTKQSSETLDKLYKFMLNTNNIEILEEFKKPSEDFLNALKDDLNTHLAITILYKNLCEAKANPNEENKSQLMAEANLLGLLYEDPNVWFNLKVTKMKLSEEEIKNLVEQRTTAKKNKDFSEADRIRDYLLNLGIIVEDYPTGSIWKVK
jgi:cysteinyl-tRNA synthetase